MNTRRVPVSRMSVLALVAALALLPWAAVAGEKARLDEQFTGAAARGDVQRVKSPRGNGQVVAAEDQDTSFVVIKVSDVHANALSNKRWEWISSTPLHDRTESLRAALGPDDLSAITIPFDQPASIDDRPKPRIPPYEERERIAIPETFGAGRECFASAYEAITDEYLIHLDIAALVCFSCNKGNKARTCVEARSRAWGGHQFVDRLERVPIFRDREPRQGILFVAKFSGGGSGWSRLITLWVYLKDCGQFVNILPGIVIAKRDAFKLLGDHEVKGGGVLVVTEGGPAVTCEPTALDPRRYWIRIYRYSHKEKRFKPLAGGEFLTEKAYSFEGDWFGLEPTTEVIDDHLDKIRRIIERRCSNRRIPSPQP